MELCKELQMYIYDYMQPIWLKNVDKIRFHKYINKEYIVSETSIRRLVRKDSDFILNLLLEKNIDKFIKHKKYIYKTASYKNYLEFIIYYCVNNQSPKCINIIKNNYGNYLIKHKNR